MNDNEEICQPKDYMFNPSGKLRCLIDELKLNKFTDKNIKLNKILALLTYPYSDIYDKFKDEDLFKHKYKLSEDGNSVTLNDKKFSLIKGINNNKITTYKIYDETAKREIILHKISEDILVSNETYIKLKNKYEFSTCYKDNNPKIWIIPDKQFQPLIEQMKIASNGLFTPDQENAIKQHKLERTNCLYNNSALKYVSTSWKNMPWKIGGIKTRKYKKGKKYKKNNKTKKGKSKKYKTRKQSYK